MHPKSDVIAAALGFACDGLLAMHIQKILYLADLEAWRTLGHPISDCEFTFYKYGPFDKAIDSAIGDLCSEKVALFEHGFSQKSGREFRRFRLASSRLKMAPSDRIRVEEAAILRRVVERYEHVPSDTLKEIVYQTRPMRGAARSQRLDLEKEKGKTFDTAEGLDWDNVALSLADIRAGRVMNSDEFWRSMRQA